ncbi:MAG: cytochrome c oxidase subunit II [Dehalococcoidia bacterium]
MGRSGPGRIIAIVVSLVITAAVSGLLYYWFKEAAFLGADSMTTWEPASDNAQQIHDVYVFIFWLAGAVFVGVMFLVLLFSLMFKEQEGVEAVQTHGNSRLEILWTFIPVIIVVAMAVPTFDAIVAYEGDPPADQDVLEVIAVGHQWWFEFRYPELGITTATDMYVPVDRPVHVTLYANDVIHSFWVPRLMGKKDMMPSRENNLWFTPNAPGVYLGQCAEFCGLSHAQMRFRVIVEEQAGFDAWVANAQQPTAPTDELDGLVAEGAQLFLQAGCVGCHVIDGYPGAVGRVGPNLTLVGSRTTLAGGWLENNPEELASWLRNPPAVKPGSLMPDLDLSDDQIDRLVAYLQTLQ